MIRLAAGTYPVASTLTISREVTITAADAAVVVLDGQNARRLMHITGGTVHIIGLSIIKGYVSGSVRKKSLPNLCARHGLIRA